MPVEIEFLGWATFRFITDGGTKIITDPFLEGDASCGIPPCVATTKDLSDTHVVIVTHAARDHSAQAEDLIKASGATLFSSSDVGIKALKAGIPSERVFSMAPGVQFNFRDIDIKALEASHLSMSEFKGHWLSGVPLSFIVDFGSDGKIFFSGDNALGAHYHFIGELYQPDLAILGIGGVKSKGQFFTVLYPHEAVVATKWLKVKAVIPMHYLGNEAEVFKQELLQQAPGVDLVIMKPGEPLRFSSTKGFIH